jgi:hypothetical protein
VPRSRNVLLAPLPGQCHELELLVTSLLLSSEETGVTLLASGQPLQSWRWSANAEAGRLVLFSRRPAELTRHLRLASMLNACCCWPAKRRSGTGQPGWQPVVCLGAQGSVMRQRLRQFLAGQLDT